MVSLFLLRVYIASRLLVPCVHSLKTTCYRQIFHHCMRRLQFDANYALHTAGLSTPSPACTRILTQVVDALRSQGYDVEDL